VGDEQVQVEHVARLGFAPTGQRTGSPRQSHDTRTIALRVSCGAPPRQRA
jgi:hypothetical protein